MSNTHTTADVGYLVGYPSVELGREVRAGDRNFESHQHMVFEAVRKSEVSKRVECRKRGKEDQ